MSLCKGHGLVKWDEADVCFHIPDPAWGRKGKTFLKEEYSSGRSLGSERGRH